MDEQEEADRMAAAEALYMISTRADKDVMHSRPRPKTSKRERKKKYPDSDISPEDPSLFTGSVERSEESISRRGRIRSRRGRGSRGDRVGGRSRAASQFDRSLSMSRKGQKRENVQRGDEDYVGVEIPNLLDGESADLKTDATRVESKAKPESGKSKKQKTKGKHVVVPNENPGNWTADVHPRITLGFTGAAISAPKPPLKTSSEEYMPARNLPSLGLTSGLRQVSLESHPTSVSGLQSLNSNLTSLGLTSISNDALNLPSLPLEIGSLQLSSVPTPNLSSLGDMKTELVEEDEASGNRTRSEKFLPLKKRKLHTPKPEVEDSPLSRSPAPASSSDPEDHVEVISPSMQPIRVTVQAPPMITMQTLMELKTALTADDDGDLPLHIAVVHENMRMVYKLINLMKIAGKGVDKFNKQQQTPLHLAVKLDFVEAVVILIKAGASVNAVDCTGSSAIHMAVQKSSLRCLETLLDMCPVADLNTRNFEGLTPLHLAVDQSSLQLAHLLLKSGSDIDTTDGKSGRTALFRAAESNQKAMVELLLREGANADIPNYAGVTCSMAAQGRSLHGVLKLLGSVAIDFAMDYKTKMSVLTVESKPSIHVGFQAEATAPVLSSTLVKEDSKTSSPLHQELPSSVLNQDAGVGLNLVKEPVSETKVFHNVFVVSHVQHMEHSQRQGQKSNSEPSSPEVKMEINEEWETSKEKRRLVSLPDVLMMPRGAVERESEARFPVTAPYSRSPPSGASSPHVVLRQVDESKPNGESVTTQISSNRETSGAHKNRDLNKAQRVSASPLMPEASSSPISLQGGMPVGVVMVPPGKSLKTSAHVTPNSAGFASEGTLSMTANQARLYQQILETFKSKTAGAPAASANGQARTSSSSVTSVDSTLLASPTVTSPSPNSLAPMLFGKRGKEELSSFGTNAETPTRVDQQQPEPSTLNSTRPHVGILKKAYVIPSPLSMTSGGSSPQVLSGQKESRHVYPTTSGLLFNVKNLVSPPSSPRSTPLNLSSKQNFSGEPIRQNVRRKSVDDKSGPDLNQIQGRPSHVTFQDDIGTISVKGTVVETEGVEKRKHDEHSTHNQILFSGTGVAVDAATDTTSVPAKPAHMVQKFLSKQQPPHHQQLLVQSSTSSSKVLSLSPVPSSPNPLSTAVGKTSSSSILPSLSQSSTALNLSTHQNEGIEYPVITLTRTASNIVTITKATANFNVTKSLDISPSTVSQAQGSAMDLSKPRLLTTLTEDSGSPPNKQHGALALGQGKVVGFSGAILSVVSMSSDKKGDNVVLTEAAKPAKVKESCAKEVTKKRGRKPNKVKQELGLVSDGALPKINSETDHRLKMFLGAKKNVQSAVFKKGHITEQEYLSMSGSEGIDTSRPKSGAEVQGGVSVLGDNQSSVPASNGPVLETVGIFSGDVQHVRMKKTSIPVASSSSTLTSTTTSSSLLSAVHLHHVSAAASPPVSTSLLSVVDTAAALASGTKERLIESERVSLTDAPVTQGICKPNSKHTSTVNPSLPSPSVPDNGAVFDQSEDQGHTNHVSSSDGQLSISSESRDPSLSHCTYSVASNEEKAKTSPKDDQVLAKDWSHVYVDTTNEKLLKKKVFSSNSDILAMVKLKKDWTLRNKAKDLPSTPSESSASEVETKSAVHLVVQRLEGEERGWNELGDDLEFKCKFRSPKPAISSCTSSEAGDDVSDKIALEISESEMEEDYDDDSLRPLVIEEDTS